MTPPEHGIPLSRDPKIIVRRGTRVRGTVEEAMIRMCEGDVYYAGFREGYEFRAEQRAQRPRCLSSESWEGERVVYDIYLFELAWWNGNYWFGSHGGGFKKDKE